MYDDVNDNVDNKCMMEIIIIIITRIKINGMMLLNILRNTEISLE